MKEVVDVETDEEYGGVVCRKKAWSNLWWGEAQASVIVEEEEDARSYTFVNSGRRRSNAEWGRQEPKIHWGKHSLPFNQVGEFDVRRQRLPTAQ